MSKTKKLLALLLSVLFVLSAVFSLPMAVNAEDAPEATVVPLNEDYYDSLTAVGTEGSKDYLSFTTISEDAYYYIKTKNIDITTHSWSSDLYLYFDILNGAGERLERIRLNKDSEGTVSIKLEPDTTYFMEVYNKYGQDTKGGNYKINITYTLDPEGNEKESSTQWKLEETYFGNIAAKGDADWFKITTNEETDYTFTVKNISIPTHSWSYDNQFRGVLYNDKNEILADMRMTADKEESQRITLDANATYYVEIWDRQGTTGEYSFDLSVTVIIDEEAVGMAGATEIPYNEDYYDSITNWEGDNKTDYLKFTTLNEAAYYTLTAKNINIPTHSWSGDHQVQFIIWNEYKEELGRMCRAEGAEDSVTLLLDENTTYYIRINNNENNGGNYKVNLSYVLDPEPNTMEDGNPLRVGERYYGNIAANGDRDFFTITTGEDTEYTLLVKNINIPTHSWSGDYQFRAVLYNKYSEEMGKVLATNGEENTVMLTLDPDTTYYIGVWDPDGTKGDYNVLLAKSMILGDVDLNGNIKIQDATLIQKALAKLATLDAKQNLLADATEDAKVNIKDATAIQKYLAKIDSGTRVGVLILVEEEFDEPATKPSKPVETPEVTEATVATNEPEVTTETPVATSEPEITTEAPVYTTAFPVTEPSEETTASISTEPTEMPTTTPSVETEPTEVPSSTAESIATEPTIQETEVTTQATQATDATEATQATTEAVTTEATVPTEATEPTVTKSKFDELKEVVELASQFLTDKEAYKGEAPLDPYGSELTAKKDMFGVNVSAEDKNLNEYYKLKNRIDRILYEIARVGVISEEESERLLPLVSTEYVWFNYYVTELHPEPSGRVVYFENTVNWINPHVFYFKSGGSSSISYPGVKMSKVEGEENMYWAEIPTGYKYIQFNVGTYYIYSKQYNIEYDNNDGFRLKSPTVSSSGKMEYYVESFSYSPFEVDY